MCLHKLESARLPLQSVVYKVLKIRDVSSMCRLLINCVCDDTFNVLSLEEKKKQWQLPGDMWGFVLAN